MASQSEIQTESTESLKSKPPGLCILWLFSFLSMTVILLWPHILHIKLPTPLHSLIQCHINKPMFTANAGDI